MRENFTRMETVLYYTAELISSSSLNLMEGNWIIYVVLGLVLFFFISFFLLLIIWISRKNYEERDVEKNEYRVKTPVRNSIKRQRTLVKKDNGRVVTSLEIHKISSKLFNIN